MKEIGYLYVLANSAMPNLVKVGKTTRSPSERAEELSKATGLPTPFIVVYEQLFEDCGMAESFIHVYLEEKGYRIAKNREFFNAPVNIVVKAIALAPNAINNESPIFDETEQEDDDFLQHNEPDELDDLCFCEKEPTYPWTTLFEEAKTYYYGSDDEIEDYTEAMRLFRQAAKLGALPAYRFIGDMYKYGKGVRENKNKALESYKEGARKGSAYCYWAMAMLFVDESNDEKAEKCFSLFLKTKPELCDSQRFTYTELNTVLANCVTLLGLQIEYDVNFSLLNGFIAEHSSSILEITKTWIANPDEHIYIYESIVQYIESSVAYGKNTNRDIAL
ncbi:GIY-YIG nuclease family protein [Methylovulum psychrotolerans]|uniref:GIY-YIG nuclease family protein n=1 Tax=Methylovulum psychrotolerans TaxID=1704499 RepID=UPI001BFFD43E|nr:GIY-YIG nuclease family protein [Methylovulum psychrotolerans]MBT9098721.1 GIY-YIG nuclease family protein [Methylovulum psychrotolerans]